MGIRAGIDLGTTFSAVAMIDKQTGRPVAIKNSFGRAITPSVLCFENNGEVLFGENAKDMQAAGDENAVAFFKRSMGNNAFSLEILGKTYNATDLSAILLAKLKEEAEERIGETIEAAVITVPAYFTHKEREATIQAGERAGLDVLAIINEPTAAAFAYGLNDKDGQQTVLIYDLGGGTFDVTVARIDRDNIDILGSDGDHSLGGKDWDDCVTRFLAREFLEKYGADILSDSKMSAKLLAIAESAKKQLTARDSVNVPITFGGARGNIEITEDVFEAISRRLMNATKDVIERLMDSLSLTWRDIDGVILVGGSTRMRMIRGYIKDISGKEPLGGVNEDEAVALGAAIRANITDNGETAPSLHALPGGKIPLAAIQGAKAVSDVTAHSLGMISISADGEKYINSIIIKKNSKIPISETRPFSLTTREDDNELEVYVLQGEFEDPLDNTVINKYVITEIIPGDSAVIIDVTYRYTSNGVIEVGAAQRDTGKPLAIRVEAVPKDMSWVADSPNKGQAATARNITILLAVDLSGSMGGFPIQKAKEAMMGFVDQMDPQCAKIGVLPFADQAKCVLPPTGDFDLVRGAISCVEKAKVGNGNMAEPFSTALDILETGDVRYLIVLTDGRWQCAARAIKQAKICHALGIDVMALGFGYADDEFLKEVASVDEFASFTSLDSLGESFSKIARVIGEGVTGVEVK
jgi:molecular chaperone DnaK (HSP70)